MHMKQFLGTIMALCFVLVSTAQYTIKGHVYQQTNEPVESATVLLEKNGETLFTTTTSSDGRFEIRGIKQKDLYQLIVQHVSMQNKTIDLNIVDNVTTTDINVLKQSYFLEPLEV